MTRYNFLKILGTLNGLKNAIKTAHWNETESMNKHQQLDNIYDTINNFQDGFAEDGVSIFGPIGITDIPEIPHSFYTIDGLVTDVMEYALRLKNSIAQYETADYAGLNSLCDNFVHDMKISMYRFRMK